MFLIRIGIIYMLIDYKIHLISLDQIKVPKNSVRVHDVDVGTDDLAASIRANGLLQPVVAYFDAEKKYYLALIGQRRLIAYYLLNEKYPGEGFDKIKCILIDEPESNEKKISLSLAENITQIPMTKPDLIQTVTRLYNVYGNYKMIQQKFGITPKQIDIYVRMARLPEPIKDAIRDGKICPNPKTAETVALKAVDATNYTKNGTVSVENVLELAREMTGGKIDQNAIAVEAKKGGNLEGIKERARKQPRQKFNIQLSTEHAIKLKRVAESTGENEQLRASQYVADGINQDFDQMEREYAE